MRPFFYKDNRMTLLSGNHGHKRPSKPTTYNCDIRPVFHITFTI